MAVRLMINPYAPVATAYAPATRTHLLVALDFWEVQLMLELRQARLALQQLLLQVLQLGPAGALGERTLLLVLLHALLGHDVIYHVLNLHGVHAPGVLQQGSSVETARIDIYCIYFAKPRLNLVSCSRQQPLQGGVCLLGQPEGVSR